MAEKGERCSSKVWDYFSKDSSNAVFCNICAANVSQGSIKAKQKNTSNLWTHLKTKHSEQYKEAQQQSEVQKTLSVRTQQPTLPQAFDKVLKWGPSDPRAKNLDKKVMEMIATDIQAFSVVEGVGFRRLLAAAEPRYTLKTEKFYRTDKLHHVHAKVVIKIKELLAVENAKHIAFTTDCWSGSTESLMSLTAHFIDEEWNRVQVVLNVKAMSGSHTGEYIGQLFLDMLTEWDIDSERVLLVLRDSGANVVKGMRLVEMPDLSCSAHTLQLVVNDGLQAQRAVGDILAKLKRCATHFGHSVPAKQRLEQIQKDVGLPEHRILQACPTRWNSTLHMLQRMQEQKRALTVYSGDFGHFTCPSVEEWDLVEKLINTLEPIEEITLEVSKSDASASCIIPTIEVLKRFLETQGPETRGIQTLRKVMLDSLIRRFSKIAESKEAVLACVLDPRYKQRPLSDSTTKKAKTWLEKEADKQHQASSAATHKGAEEYSKKPRMEKSLDQKQSVLDHLYEDMLQSQQTVTGVSESLNEELDRYLQEPVLDRKTGDPLQWWRQNAGRFQTLAPLARRFLTPPPSSVPSERVFSTVGAIYQDRRSSLTGSKAEMLCFLYYNLPLLNWQY
uniref:BED-type domain-containing protein n=2 Tax=Cyprinus carpio TaxID=7962 RepID=A0A8C1F800_CYPCA